MFTLNKGRCANPRKWPEMEDSLPLIWLSRPNSLWCSLVSCNQTYFWYSLFSLWPAVLLTSWLQPKNCCFLMVWICILFIFLRTHSKVNPSRPFRFSPSPVGRLRIRLSESSVSRFLAFMLDVSSCRFASFLALQICLWPHRIHKTAA